MAKDMFSAWDDAMDVEGLQKDIESAASGKTQGDFKEVPHGNYEVAVNKMELKASKKGDPMVSIWFKIVDGQYKNSILFYNQVITQGFQIHNCNEMLRSLTSDMADAPVIDFKGYKQYSELLLDIFEGVANDFEYGLKYTANKKNKDFSDFEITEVFILD